MTLERDQAFGPRYGFGLYIHWPYCTRICPYCDFNVYAAKQRDPAALIAAMLNDLAEQSAALAGHPPLQSIFFGGGTPSLLTSDEMALFMTAASDRFGLETGCEITLECNPNDVLTADLAGWRECGINRVSLGIQSLDDTALRFLGRDHDSQAALRAVRKIQAMFDNYSLDFIYARPGQSLQDWQTELDQALGLGAPHLSLYQLTIEPATPFGKRAARGILSPLPDDMQADLFALTQEMCQTAGIPAYEVSNHAASADVQARHNHIYWASGDWLGIGPGAHGRLTRNGHRYATQTPARPQTYMTDATPLRSGLSDEDIALEFLAMGLRPSEGIARDRYAALFGKPVSEAALSMLIDAGLVLASASHISLTDKGRLLADYVSARLI